MGLDISFAMKMLARNPRTSFTQLVAQFFSEWKGPESSPIHSRKAKSRYPDINPLENKGSMQKTWKDFAHKYVRYFNWSSTEISAFTKC